MTVGIIDLDLIYNKKNYTFNIDVMHISSYYKRHGDVVKLCYTTDNDFLGRYNLIYVVKNTDVEVFIDNLIKDERVVLIGEYFYGNYDVLPVEIQNSYPDKTIYEALLSSNFLSKSRTLALKRDWMVSDYIKLHRNNYKNFISSDSKVVVICDKDLTVYDLKEIEAIKNKRYRVIFPVAVHTKQEAEQWLDSKFIRRDLQRSVAAVSFTEKDLNWILSLPAHTQNCFIIRFGYCDPSDYNFELKKFIRFAQKTDHIHTPPQIEFGPIKSPEYMFLYHAVKTWYCSKKSLENSILQVSFKKPEHYKLILKIKALDPELHYLLTSTRRNRLQNDKNRQNYRTIY